MALFIILSVLGFARPRDAQAEGFFFDPAERGQPLLQSKLPIVRDVARLKSKRGPSSEGIRRLLSRMPIAFILGELGDLEDLIVNEHSDARRATIVEELVYLGVDIPLSAYVNAFEHASFDAAPILAKLLQESGKRKAFDALAAGLERVQTRGAAEAALIEIGEPAIDALIQQAKQGQEREQSALRVMGRIGGESARAYLKATLETPDYAVSMGARQGLIFMEEGPDIPDLMQDLEAILLAMPPPARLDLLMRRPSIPIERAASYLKPEAILSDAKSRARIASGDPRMIDLLLMSQSRARSPKGENAETLSLLAQSRAGWRALLAYPMSGERDASLLAAYFEEKAPLGRAEIKQSLKESRGAEFVSLLESDERRTLFAAPQEELRIIAIELAYGHGDSAALLAQLEVEDSAAIATLILRRLRALGVVAEKPILHRLKHLPEARVEALIALARKGSEGLTEFEALSSALRRELRSSSPSERRLLALALGFSENIDGLQGAKRSLLRALRDDDPHVRSASILAFHRLDPRAARDSARALKRIERDPIVLPVLEGIISATLAPSALEEAIRVDPFHDPLRFMLVSEAIRSFPIDRDALPAARSEREY